MGRIEGLSQIRLGPEHAAAGLALSSEAGWNQTIADWRLMIELGDAFGLVTDDGHLVASALDLPYGRFAWISMMLVTESFRGQGLARRLMQACLEHAAGHDLTALLDATPLGEPVYRQLGFEPVFRFHRWLAQDPRAPEARGVRAASMDDLDRIATLDARAFGARRPKLLESLVRRSAGRAGMGENGFVLARDGRLATQIGPLVAENTACAERLLARAIGAGQGPVCLDLPEHHGRLVPFLEAAGFTPTRPFLRMRMGSREPFGDSSRYVLVAGPELG